MPELFSVRQDFFRPHNQDQNGGKLLVRMGGLVPTVLLAGS